MFKWLKRLGSATVPAPREKKASPRPRPPSTSRKTAAPSSFEPSTPLPEVVGEGNTQADWSVWEDSVTALDSQLQGLLPSQRVYVRDTRPSQLDDDDPFASVRGKRDA